MICLQGPLKVFSNSPSFTPESLAVSPTLAPTVGSSQTGLYEDSLVRRDWFHYFRFVRAAFFIYQSNRSSSRLWNCRVTLANYWRRKVVHFFCSTVEILLNVCVCVHCHGVKFWPTVEGEIVTGLTAIQTCDNIITELEAVSPGALLAAFSLS